MLEAGPAEMETGREISEKLAAERCEPARLGRVGADTLSLRRAGRAWRAILEAGRECDAAVIVLGRRGASAVELKILGSVTNAVTQHADRPVLVVPSPR